jgi:hypothetical protein
MLNLTIASKQKFIEFTKNILAEDIIPESLFLAIEQWKLDNPYGRVFFIEREWTACHNCVPYLFETYDWYDKP